MHALAEEASGDLEASLPVLRAGWRPLETKIEQAHLRAEDDAEALHRAGDAGAAADRLTRFMRASAAEVLETAVQLRGELVSARAAGSPTSSRRT